MQIRQIDKTDFDFLVTVLDRWWGGPSGQRADPIFFYEFGEFGFVAEQGGDLIGFLLGFISSRNPRTGYVHLVGIHPEHRRKRVGRQLYEHFGSECRKAGVSRLKAIAPLGHEGSVRFHRALGFDVQADEDYAGPGRGRVVFLKPL